MSRPCRHCPIGSPCPGQFAPRVCDLANPAHPAYREGYQDTLAEHARARPAQYPRLLVQAKNLARSLRRWAVARFALASEREQARRASICAGCPHWVAGQARCQLCGCKTNAKRRLKSEHCPDAPPRW